MYYEFREDRNGDMVLALQIVREEPDGRDSREYVSQTIYIPIAELAEALRKQKETETKRLES
jgi:hypothetical protein